MNKRNSIEEKLQIFTFKVLYIRRNAIPLDKHHKFWLHAIQTFYRVFLINIFNFHWKRNLINKSSLLFNGKNEIPAEMVFPLESHYTGLLVNDTVIKV